MHFRNVRISSTRQLPKWRRYVRETSSACEYGRWPAEKSFFRMLKTAGSTLLFAATGVAGVEYSGSATKIRAGSWQNGAHSLGGQASSRQSRWPASLSAELS